MPCPVCGFENPPGSRFCGSCGASLAITCPSCGTGNPPGFRFCVGCGTALPAGPEPENAPPAPGAERRRVTVVFADLVGFSTLAEDLDPEELATLISETFADVAEEVERRGGTVSKFIGDAVVAVFGTPVAHDDDPVRAVEAALAMIEVVRRRSSAAPLELRIGINSGLVVAGMVDDGGAGILGDAVNVAARLQQAAGAGEILLAASTWRRVRDRFAAEPLGALSVKGRTRTVETYRLEERLDRERRDRAPFVGRREELALLELLWSSARRGNAHVVSVVGEPGVGKSRLVSELGVRGEALDVRIACTGERAFGPFVELVEAVLGGTPASLGELRARLGELALEEEDVILLAAFLGLEEAPPGVRMADAERSRQVFAGYFRFLLAACRERPSLLVLDDVHWIDESSRELLTFILERLVGAPLMLVLLYRPGLELVERAELRASHTAVRLEPLDRAESVELARGFLGVAELPPDLERLVAGRAEGNPFFIEELLQALVDLGSLAVVGDTAVLARVDVEIPDTVQGTILARVDRLEPRLRTILQHAAVLGRSASVDLLEQVAAGGNVADAVRNLTRAQLLVTPEPGRWAFKHALIQEVTYETLLLRRRRELHERVARVLEAGAADDPRRLEALAYHYARAERPVEARRFAVAAGDLARERSGFVDAKGRYEAALRLWGEGDEKGRLELLMRLGYAALLAGDGAGARTALIEADAGFRRLGETARAGAALALLGRVHWIAGRTDEAAQVLGRAIGALRERGPSPELVEAYTRASTLHMLDGDIDAATELATEGLHLAEALGLEGQRAHLLNNLGSTAVFAGDPGGVELIRQSLTVAESAGDTEAIGRAYVNLSSTLADGIALREAAETAARGSEVVRRRGAAQFEWFIANNGARALLLLGRYEEADALTARMLKEERALLGVSGAVAAGMTRAELLARTGRLEEARIVADEFFPLARGVGGPDYLAGALAVEAAVEEARGNAAAAEQAAREAAAFAFGTPARAHWLRVLPYAARLLPAEEARRFLEQAQAEPTSTIEAARLAEARGVIEGDAGLAREAADLYRELEMPYEEARCRLDAGDAERAQELAGRYGFQLPGVGGSAAPAPQTGVPAGEASR